MRSIYIIKHHITMPRNFQNGKIYLIRSPSTDLVYVGSTTQKLSQRMREHRSHHKHDRGITSGLILKYGNAYVELYEDYPCNSVEELNRREGIVTRLHNYCNKIIQGRTKKEHYIENKAEAAAYKKKWHIKNKERLNNAAEQYRKDNKDKIKAYRSQKINCGCGQSYTRGHAKRHLDSLSHCEWHEFDLISRGE